MTCLLMNACTVDSLWDCPCRECWEYAMKCSDDEQRVPYGVWRDERLPRPTNPTGVSDDHHRP